MAGFVRCHFRTSFAHLVLSSTTRPVVWRFVSPYPRRARVVVTTMRPWRVVDESRTGVVLRPDSCRLRPGRLTHWRMPFAFFTRHGRRVVAGRQGIRGDTPIIRTRGHDCAQGQIARLSGGKSPEAAQEPRTKPPFPKDTAARSSPRESQSRNPPLTASPCTKYVRPPPRKQTPGKSTHSYPAPLRRPPLPCAPFRRRRWPGPERR